MSRPHIRIAEIEVNASPNDERIVGIFRYESDQNGKRGPLVILLAEIISTLYVYEQLLDVVNDAIERLRSLTSAVDADPMGRFEKLVQGVNEAASTFLAAEPSAIAWNRVNLFLLEIDEEHLCLAGVGHLCNLFVQRQPNDTTRAFDLFGSLEQPAEVNPHKIFSALIFGEMKAGDVLFAGTQNFERLRQELAILPRLKSLPPVTAALEIQQSLEELHIPDDFGAVIVAQVDLPEPPIKPAVASHTSVRESPEMSSVEKMYAEEKTTEAVLNSTMTPLSSSRTAPHGTLREYVTEWKSRLKRLPSAIREACTRKPSTHDPVTMTGLRTMHAGHGASLTGTHKRMIFAAVMVLLLCVSGTAWYHRSQRIQAEQTAWQSAYDQAFDKKNRAEAGIVYGDDDRSLRLVQEAEALLGRLDQNTPARLEASKTLAIALKDTRAKLRKELPVNQPRVLFTLPPEAVGTVLTQLTFANGKLYTFDQHAKHVVMIDATNNTIKNITWSDAASPTITIAEKDSALFLTQDHKAYRADPARESVSPVPYDAKGEGPTTAGSLYGKRLYLLDPTTNMIWRHNVGTSIGAGSPYLKQTSVSLSGATTLAIDSNVYVGLGNGQLIRYLSGAQESWALTPIDPPLANISALWTASDTDRIVISDMVGKRIVVFRKDGKLVGQITSPALTGSPSIVVDPTAKILFVADGRSVYAFDLP